MRSGSVRSSTRRFGLPRWQFALTATDANRFAIRLARELTGRPKILVFNWCYHGTVDETFASLDGAAVVSREGNVGPPVPLEETTRVVEWNDVEALERELAHGDVACVLAEPALTNIGIVLPEPDFHAALREADAQDGDAADHRRDAHALCGAGRLHGCIRSRPGSADGREGDRGRHSRRCVRVLRRRGGPARGDAAAGRARGRRRDRRDRCCECPVTRRDACHARRGADGRRIRAHDLARGAVRSRGCGRD